MATSGLAATKRRLYVVALAVVLPFLPVVALVQREREVAALTAYGAMTVVVAGVLAGLVSRRMSLAVAERVIIAVISTVVLARLAAVALPATRDPDVVRALVTETTGPTLVAMVLVVFLSMETRPGLAWTATIWAVFTALLVPGLVDFATSAPSVAVAIGRQSLTLLITVGLASGLASLKAQLATERTRSSAAAELAVTDPLTGIRNRRGTTDVLETHLETARRYHGAVSVALVDLDRFKARNDNLGHAAGDDALVRIAEAVGADLRAADTLGRWGGDELLVVAPESSAPDAHAVAERWRARIEALGLAAGERIVTASIGVATYEAGDTIESLLIRADRAMYAAKAAGGNRVVTRLGGHAVDVVSSVPAPG